MFVYEINDRRQRSKSLQEMSITVGIPEIEVNYFQN